MKVSHCRHWATMCNEATTMNWTDEEIVVIDFETTGTNPANCMPVQIAAVRYAPFASGQLVELDAFCTLLNPGCPIPPDATAIHGKTDAMVQGAPPLEAVLEALAQTAGAALPCAYNAPYDSAILHRYTGVHAAELGLASPDKLTTRAYQPQQTWVDPMVIVRKVDRDVVAPGKNKLMNACIRHGVRVDGNAHDALTDCRATGGLLLALHKKGLVKRCPTAALLKHTVEMRAEQARALRRYRR